MTTTIDNLEIETIETLSKGEHLAYCKIRALAHVDSGDVRTGWKSFLSDMNKHPETATHVVLELGILLYTRGHLDNPGDMRSFIKAFN